MKVLMTSEQLFFVCVQNFKCFGPFSAIYRLKRGHFGVIFMVDSGHFDIGLGSFRALLATIFGHFWVFFGAILCPSFMVILWLWGVMFLEVECKIGGCKVCSIAGFFLVVSWVSMRN